jgi:DNA invertase Pin-like site-specific DNA recombinase
MKLHMHKLPRADNKISSKIRRPRLIGYLRISRADVSESEDLQRDALFAAGVSPTQLYSDTAECKRDYRPGLAACLGVLKEGDILVVWKLDRLGRSLHHLVNIVQELSIRGIGLKVLTGQGAAIDTTTTAGRLVYGIFASLAEFERNMINERLVSGPPLSRARGRNGGRKPKMTPEQLRSAMAALGEPETKVDQLCRELGVTLSTLYRYVSPTGELRE